MTLDEIKNLDVKEKIILMNNIWESLESEDVSVESPPWHNDILEKRIEKLKNSKAKIISIDELTAIPTLPICENLRHPC
jgi:putative addiction module component (TIGR02574 family)